jgi:hypothetical protein
MIASLICTLAKLQTTSNTYQQEIKPRITLMARINTKDVVKAREICLVRRLRKADHDRETRTHSQRIE